MTLDLHGYDIHSAWGSFQSFISQPHTLKYIRVITGQGDIKREFPMWVEANPKCKRCELEYTQGSFKVYLYK